ncbi:hypothetical protein B0H13DRAFT_2393527 [Mycena leptocephala]|nr:hypothetical protein B0H13DRAFT_2393527 [Mycena leptocephala]
MTAQWRREFGPNFRFTGLFIILHSSDIKAVNHIITNNSIYQKSPFGVDFARRLLGNVKLPPPYECGPFDAGVFSVVMDDHKRQRRIMACAA